MTRTYGAGYGELLSAHARLTRRERRAAALRRALTVAVRRAELAGADPAPGVASFDRARARGGRPGRQ